MSRLLLATLLGVVVAGCQLFGSTQVTPDQDSATNSAVNTNSGAVVSDTTDPVVIPSDVSMVSYTNRAIGYTIQRPERWFWQHDILTNSDRFATDRKALQLTAGDTLAQGVSIYVWLQDAAPALDAAGFTQTSEMVSGVDASKMVGTRRLPGSDVEQFITVYQFDFEKRIYRLQFVSTTKDNPDSAIFEAMVKSFTLAE
jgi:hypothetical protein